MIVLDTHVIIWDALTPEKLSIQAKEAIDLANEEDGIIFCDISLWEIAMLIKKERLKIDIGYQDFINLVLNANKYIVYNITPEIAELSVDLPDSINKDPADRIIVATSIVADVPLVTVDENLIRSEMVNTLW
jgi:PIN domain nuclease of toxin-antitoxin system